MRVLIYGNGFIGGHLKKHLMKQGYEVDACGKSDDTDDTLKFFLRHYQYNVVVHLAAYVKNTDEAIHLKNMELSQHVVDLVSFYQPDARIIYTSTMNVYKPSTDKALNEQSPIGPDTLYCWSKAASEHIISQHKNSVILRLSNVYGPGMNNGVMLKMLKMKEIGMGTNETRSVRSYIYVSDVCEAIEAAMKTEWLGVFNIASPINSYPLQKLAKLMGVEVLVDLTRNGIPCVSYNPDITKANLKLNWGPKKTDFQENLRGIR